LPYYKLLERLRNEPSQSPLDLSRHLVTETKRYYAKPDKLYQNVQITQAAFNCNSFQDLFKQTGNFSRELNTYLQEGGAETIKGCINNSWEEGGIFKDLRGLSLNLLDENIPVVLRKTAEGLINLLNNPEFVLAAEVSKERYSPNEISIYCPLPGQFNDTYLSAVKDLPPDFKNWVLFLSTYHKLAF